MSGTDLRLKDGSKIAVIGGGPAGAFFSHFASNFARERNLDVSLTLFDGKDFHNKGASGCNMGAGVVAETLIDKLEEEGIHVPEVKIQRKVGQYCLQTENHSLLLTHPHGRNSIFIVFRGNGPRFSVRKENISFDDFLLDHVRGLGVKVINEPVRDIFLPANFQDPVRLIYGRGEDKEEFKADLVVGAFGVNTTLAKKIENLHFGYRPPRTFTTCQAEIKLSEEYIQSSFGNVIMVFTPGLKRARFVALIPKKGYLTFVMIGSRNLDDVDLVKYIHHPIILRYLPQGWRLPERYCHCHPKIVVTSSKHPFIDRFVIIGDASFSKYYKNGLQSAFLTAEIAAKTAFNYGISSQAFKKGYFRRAKKLIVRDNLYGKILLRVYDFICKRELLTEIYMRVASCEKADIAGKLARSIVWNIFTGNIPYRGIFFKALNPILSLRFSLVAAQVLVERGIRVLLNGWRAGKLKKLSVVRGPLSVANEYMSKWVNGRMGKGKEERRNPLYTHSPTRETTDD